MIIHHFNTMFKDFWRNKRLPNFISDSDHNCQQENAYHGIYPKSFVARQLTFRLIRLTIVIRDEDLKDSEIVRLTLAEVRWSSFEYSSFFIIYIFTVDPPFL